MTGAVPRVPKGAPIAVIAPCHAYSEEKLAVGMERLRAEGYALHPLSGLAARHRYHAGDDAHRLSHLVEALTSPEFAAVWMVRGGSGLTRLLPKIPWDRLRRRPLLGFSDATALLGPLHARGLGPAIHAPVLHSLGATDEASIEHLLAVLEGRPTAPLRGEPWVAGRAEGWLAGGNLCVLAALCGTPHQLDARGAVLVLEEVGELPYRVDRLMQQLVSAGVFVGVRAVALGEFTGCGAPEGAAWTLREVLMDHLVPLGVPVLAGLPIGHGSRNRAFVLGDRVTLDGDTWTLQGSAAV